MVAKKVTQPKFVPLDDVLSTETAFLQASCLLDIAAMLALESKDTEQLTVIGAHYIELGSRLMGPDPDEDELEEHDLESESGFGFSPLNVPDTEVAHGRTNSRREAKAKSQSYRIPRIHPQHGEL